VSSPEGSAAQIGPGSRLGSYEITGKLGEGGMGEVYRATDTRLKREVAIKVLPAAFTADPERLARFEREAQLLAQLHHPRIASIFGVEESEGVRALVMELVEGPTLGERQADGPLPLDECLEIALQIAEALEVAHEKGIVHRDLKPANVKLAPDGKVKVLDFGLAKALDPTASDPGAAALEASPTLMNSPTLTAMGTQLGVILGTAAYMSPEQARGKGVDKRADIWAFGVVLYEMLSSRRLFAADSVPDTLAGVLKTEIDWDRLPATVPPGIRRLLRRCLDRNPNNRLRDIGDARLVLQETLAGELELPAAAAVHTPAPPAWRRWLPWAVAAACLALLALSLASRPTARPVYSDLAPPAHHFYEFLGDPGAPAILSPDGRRLVFGARAKDARAGLWIRELDTGVERQIPGTEGAFAPFFSADSGSVGFFAEGEMRIVSLAGGQPHRVAEAGNGRGGAWAADGTIVYAPEFRSPLFKISASGGEPEQLTTIDLERHSTHRWPVFTDRGKAVLFLATHHSPNLKDQASVRYVRLDGSGEREVLRLETNVRVAAGHLLFVRDTTLFAQPFDASRGALSGAPRPIAQDVLYDPSTWRGIFAATDRRLIFGTGLSVGTSRISWFDPSGTPPVPITGEAFWGDVRLSPDARMLAATRSVEGGPLQEDLWLIGLERGTQSRLTFEPGPQSRPVWSPDGVWVYYVSGEGEEPPRRIYRKRASGAGSAESVFAPEEGVDASVTDISPDGKTLLLQLGTYPYERDSDLALLPLDGSAKPRKLFETPYSEGEGRFSADGELIAYSSNEAVSGFSDIFVLALGEDGLPRGRWLVTPEGGRTPTFSADGSQLIVTDGNENVLRIDILRQLDGSLRFGPAQPLFAVTTLPERSSRDVAPDGRIVVAHVSAEPSLPLRLIENWTALLDH
jgi:eukaryotic-like serine/threonine-protein kinase